MTREEIRNKYLAYVSTSLSSAGAVPFKKPIQGDVFSQTYSAIVQKQNSDSRSRSVQSNHRQLIPSHLGETHVGIVSWYNKEEEWWFTNKRLIFATKQDDVADEWVKKFSEILQVPALQNLVNNEDFDRIAAD